MLEATLVHVILVISGTIFRGHEFSHTLCQKRTLCNAQNGVLWINTFLPWSNLRIRTHDETASSRVNMFYKLICNLRTQRFSVPPFGYRWLIYHAFEPASSSIPVFSIYKTCLVLEIHRLQTLDYSSKYER
jgi:hypothetical protein